MTFQNPKAWWDHLSGSEKTAVGTLAAFVLGALLFASGLKVGLVLTGMN